MKRLLFIDSYDSFTYNVVHLLTAAGAHCDVVRNDDERLTPGLLERYDCVVIGPGPGTPSQAPRLLAMVRAAAERATPLLGVCLGLQAIGEALGGNVVHAPRIMHGKVSRIEHDGKGIFDGVPSPLLATRYHSLCVEEASLPSELVVTARSEDGVVQAVTHCTLPIAGVQFHPESILSEHGRRIVENFLCL